MPTITIQPVGADDYNDWSALYRGYADFYHQHMDDSILAQTWQWITTGKLHGALARNNNGNAAGFAHWEFILRPLRGVQLAYLHDLFVYQDQRGSGCGGKLLARVNSDAAAHNCQHVRWLTKANNTTARLLYDKKATAAKDWLLYQQTISNE